MVRMAWFGLKFCRIQTILARNVCSLEQTVATYSVIRVAKQILISAQEFKLC